jgi:hypothetical protein
LLESGAVRCWGSGSDGQLGYGNTRNVGEDESPAAAGDVDVVSVSGRHPSLPLPMPSTPDEQEEAEKPAVNGCEEGCKGCSLLYDSRRWKEIRPRKLSKREREVVTEAFRQHITSAECLADELHLHPSVIGTKEDHSQVYGVVDGSFTAKGRQQTIVLLFAGHCGEVGFGSENGGKRLFILIENGVRLATYRDEGAATMFWKMDMNHDGIDEVLVWGGISGAGGSASWVEARSYFDGRQRTLGSFETDVNECSFSATEHTESQVLYRWSHGPDEPCFEQRRLTLKCPGK